MKRVFFTILIGSALIVPILFINSGDVKAFDVTHTGDGTYIFSAGESVKLDNGLIIEPVLSYNAEFIEVVFKVYDENFSPLGVTEVRRCCWNERLFNYDGKTFGVKVIGYGDSGPEVTLISYESLDPQISNFDFTQAFSNPIGSHIILTWNTNIDTRGRLELCKYSICADPDESEEGGVTGKIHQLVAGGLEPGAAYFYRVSSEAVDSSIVYYPSSGWSSFIASASEVGIVTDLNIINVYDIENQSQALNHDPTLLLGKLARIEVQVDTGFATGSIGFEGPTFVDFYVDGNFLYRADLPGGGVSTSNFKDPFYWTPLIAGTYLLKVVVDPTNLVAESNESNNTLTLEIEVGLEGSITGLFHRVSRRKADISWQTDDVYNCSIVFKGKEDIIDDKLFAGVDIVTHYTAQQTFIAGIDLDHLSLPNRERDDLFYYRVVCRDLRDNRIMAKSSVRAISLSNVQLSCTDSDSGYDYNTKGSVTVDDATLVDYCFDDTLLYEAVCNVDGSNSLSQYKYTCPNGCEDGACIIQSTPQPTPEPVSVYLITDIKPGWLVKNNEFAEVFYVADDLSLRWITNEAVALKHFGSTWNQDIKGFDDLSSSGLNFGNELKESDSLSFAQSNGYSVDDIQVGWLVKNNKFAEVFYVDIDRRLRWIMNEAVAVKHFGPTWNQNIKGFDDLSETDLEFGDRLE